jgi:signal transduction histidine kinase
VKRLPSLRWRLSVAVGTALFVAVLAPAVVWVSTVAPAAWTSVTFAASFVGGTAALVVVCVSISRAFVHEVLTPIDEMVSRVDFAALSGEELPPSRAGTFVELERLLGSVRHLVHVSREREHRLETAVGALAHDVRLGLRAVATVVSQGRDSGRGSLVLPSETADLVESELERARTMASDLVVLMRERAPRTAAEGPLADVSSLVQEVATAASAGTDVKVTVQIEKPFSRQTPAALIERALRNVMDNAIRHARTSVIVRVYDGVVAVTDDGPGMGAREGSAMTSAMHGYGFEIASRMAELLGGRVVVEQSDDRGTTVLVYL